jgi:16S rRNA G966 N2-methylase RsmD
VEQISDLIKQHGFLPNKSLSVVPNCEGYVIIGGEHRFEAAKKAGLKEVPCTVYDWDEQEQLLFIVTDNAQTEIKPLEIGLNALKVVVKDSKKGFSLSQYSEKVCNKYDSLKIYYKAAEVYNYIKEQLGGASQLLETVFHLSEIHKTEQTDWQWFHDLVVKKSLSNRDCIEISKRVREFDQLTTDELKQLFDTTEAKQEIAEEFTRGKNRQYKFYKEFASELKDKVNTLGQKWELYKYNLTTKEIDKNDFNPSESLIEELKKLKDITVSSLFEVYNDLLKRKRTDTKEQAEKDKAHYEDEENVKEAEEKKKAERAARKFEHGQWWQLGQHRIYCGDSSNPEFYDNIPNAKFAFADPPYNADVAEWDNDFNWDHDWLTDKADIVGVTPGLWGLSDFIKQTEMPYQWSMAYWVDNGMGRGKMGLGNWNPILIYSTGSVHLKIQDFIKISVETSDGYEEPFKGRKPTKLIDILFSRLTKKGDTIIDPFLGSGTSLYVCQEKEIIFYGAEKDKDHFKKIIERFEDKFKIEAKVWK